MTDQKQKLFRLWARKNTIKLLWIINFLKRLFRRLKFTFRFKEMWNWQYESCHNCGINYQIVLYVCDDKWTKVYGDSEGLLCPSCFLQLAQSKKIEIGIDNIRDLWIFFPDGKSFDVIKNYNCELLPKSKS